MSFILDALKKSEQERARQQAPTTLELPQGKRRRVTPAWMLGVLVLLLVNCVLLFMMWLRREPAVPAVPASSGASSSIAATPVRSGNQQIRSLEEEAGTPQPAEDAEPETQSAPPSPATDTPLVRSIPDAASQSTDNAVAPTVFRRVAAGLPTLESLGGHTALNLPEIRLDLHVYAPTAKERFVFINGKRYAEGDTTAEGPLVENITDEGVVLSSRGRKFLLPR